MKQKRFPAKVCEEYCLFKLACPYFDEFEGKVGEAIKKHYENSSQKQINVLEIGCGSGCTSSVILFSDKRVKIVAVDNEQIMLKQAEGILRNYISNGKIKLVESDALKYIRNIPSESFDVFASGLTLHNLKESIRKRVLIEIYRILKKRGLFVNADKYALDDKEKHKKTLEWQFRQYREKYSAINKPKLAKEWISHDLEDNKKEIIMREGKSINQMKEIGFKDIKKIFRKQMHAVITAKK